MIKAIELRIGNWILDEYGDRLQMSPEYFSNASVFRQELDYTPIPLTEEWLLKFGFERDRTGFSLEDKNSLSFSVTKDGDYLSCWLDRSLGRTIKYVHQLQNLYFALTGKELEIKEDEVVATKCGYLKLPK